MGQIEVMGYQENRCAFFGRVLDEYSRTVQKVKGICGCSSMMEESPMLALSLRRRDPYLDPLNRIQITLLERTRNQGLSEEQREVWINPLLRTINAIAAGMRNTG